MPITESPTTLAVVRARQQAARSADLALLLSLVDWAVEHEVPADSDDVAGWGDQGLALAGPGAPCVSEFALLDLAAAWGRGIVSTKSRIGELLEVRYRLPRAWARVAAGQLMPWRAFRIAEKTLTLSVEAAAHVDECLAPFAANLPTAQLERTVVEAIARHDPEQAFARIEASADWRRVEIDLGQRGEGLDAFSALAATVEVSATLDLTDALDLEHAVRHTAAQLASLGSTESSDVRRALALGEIARAQLALDLGDADERTDERKGATGRAVSLNVHLHPDNPVGVLDQPGLEGQAWISQIQQWCQDAGTQVTVLPVVDLNVEKATGTYTPTEAIRRHVELRDHHCVAPTAPDPPGPAIWTTSTRSTPADRPPRSTSHRCAARTIA